MRLDGITIESPNFEPLAGLSVALHGGRVYGVCGSKGSGLSSVAKLLAGDVSHYQGTVQVQGQPVSLTTPNQATAHGIGVVRKQLVLIPSFTMLENVALAVGDAGRISKENRNLYRDRFLALTRRYDLPVQWETPLQDLSGSQQQWAHIARVLFSDPQIVAFDHTLIRLGANHRGRFLTLVHTLAEEGKCVVVISNDARALAALCDEVVVLKDGQIERVLVGAEGMRELSAMRSQYFPEPPTESVLVPRREVVLEGFGPAGLPPMSAGFPRGAIVGVAGKSHEYRRRLLRALGGEEKSQGTVVLNQSSIRITSPQQARSAGIQFFAADQDLIGPLPTRTLGDLFTGGKDSWIGRIFSKNSRVPTPMEAADILLSLDADMVPVTVVALDRPTAGLDWSESAALFARLRDLASRGATVLVNLDDLDELRGYCDVVAVIDKPGVCFEVVASEYEDESR